jgi:hypothetical protein
MTTETIETVEPILRKESVAYIENIDIEVNKINEGDVEEYIMHSIDDGNKETFASFIAIVDRFKRDDKRFKCLMGLHKCVMKTNKTYFKLYKEASDHDSEIFKMAVQRFEWNKKNLPK